MTREEAVKELYEWLDGCCGGEEIDPTREALRMAIEALKAKDLDEKLWMLNEFSTCDFRGRTIELVLNVNFEKKMALLDEIVEPKMDDTDIIYRQAAIDEEYGK